MEDEEGRLTLRIVGDVGERRRTRASARKKLRNRLDDAIGEAPDSPVGVLRSLIAECDLHAYDSRHSSSLWGRAYYILGLPAAILATVSGATGLADSAGRVPAAAIALCAAGLAAAATFLNSDEQRRSNRSLGAAWQQLADDARMCLLQFTENEASNMFTGDGDMSDKRRILAKKNLLEQVVLFNRRKSALLMGDRALADEQAGRDRRRE
ncbi:hypothetical protein [Actinomadura viridis]|uniref:SLATT domain-containing protein n=1 Tax=Actinomadura viridis TaxID=58110 RepID=A0A931DFS1_9ACTN|nr:hypothetical protein [Actinomadura viridis]MBG6090314.1 hypothetical protein [Actinomadura viridis]